ncbi:unnamed protein product [Rhizophagus irregularis]|nr:unnamed protein product [Rhizophagus irregularis]
MNVNSSLFSINPLIESNDTHKIVLPYIRRLQKFTMNSVTNWGRWSLWKTLAEVSLHQLIFRDHKTTTIAMDIIRKIVNLIMLETMLYYQIKST